MTDQDKLAAFNRILVARPRPGSNITTESDFLFLVLKETRPFVDSTTWPFWSKDIPADEKEAVLSLLWAGHSHAKHQVRHLAVIDQNNRYLCSCGSSWLFPSATVLNAINQTAS